MLTAEDLRTIRRTAQWMAVMLAFGIAWTMALEATAPDKVWSPQGLDSAANRTTK